MTTQTGTASQAPYYSQLCVSTEAALAAHSKEALAEAEAYWRELWANTEHWPTSQTLFAEACLARAEARYMAAREREAK